MLHCEGDCPAGDSVFSTAAVPGSQHPSREDGRDFLTITDLNLWSSRGFRSLSGKYFKKCKLNLFRKKYYRQSSSSSPEEIPGLRKISATEEALVIQINMSVFRSKYDEDVSN